MKLKTKIKLGAIGATTVVASGFFFSTCVTKIDAGYAGIVYSLNGGVEDTVLTQGMHIKSPFKKVIEYSVATTQGNLSKDKKEGSKDDDSFMIATSDGKTVEVDLEYSYHFDSEMLPKTFTQFKGQDGDSIEKTFMRGKLKTYVNDVSSKFSVLDIYGEKRTDLNAAILEYAREKFLEFGIVIDSINLSRIELDSQTANAIQDKINKQQELESLKIEAQKAEIQAEKDLIAKQAEADAKKIEAEAEAEAILIKAEAEAEANRLLSESLNDKLIEQQRIEKWDGSVPQVTGGAAPIIGLQ